MINSNRFIKLKEALEPTLHSLIPQLLPEGGRQGDYWVARNPTRNDKKAGSFKISISNAYWTDYATNDWGNDVISLVAYLHGLKMGEAATYLEKITGNEANDN